MVDVEFLDPAEPRRPEEPVRTHTAEPNGSATDPLRRQVVMLATSALWVALAAVGMVAAFRPVWVISYPNATGNSITMDGWGRGENVGPSAGQHGPRFAIAITVLCALALGAGVLGLLRRTAAAGRVIGAAATAGLAGVLAGAYLYSDSILDTYRAAIRIESRDPSFRASAAAGVRLHLGSLIWVGLLALLCGLAALAVPLAARVADARRGPIEEYVPVIGESMLHPDDETLVLGS